MQAQTPHRVVQALAALRASPHYGVKPENVEAVVAALQRGNSGDPERRWVIEAMELWPRGQGVALSWPGYTPMEVLIFDSLIRWLWPGSPFVGSQRELGSVENIRQYCAHWFDDALAITDRMEA